MNVMKDKAPVNIIGSVLTQSAPIVVTVKLVSERIVETV